MHNSRLDKEAIIQAAHDEGLPEFFEGVRMALDALVTFGVKQVPVKEEIWEVWRKFCNLPPPKKDLARNRHIWYLRIPILLNAMKNSRNSFKNAAWLVSNI